MCPFPLCCGVNLSSLGLQFPHTPSHRERERERERREREREGEREREREQIALRGPFPHDHFRFFLPSPPDPFPEMRRRRLLLQCQGETLTQGRRKFPSTVWRNNNTGDDLSWVTHTTNGSRRRHLLIKFLQAVFLTE